MPYLIIICVAIILVLVFNLWRAITASDFKEDAYMHVVDGSVQMKAWGTDSYFDLTVDALVMEGDEIRSSANAKVIIEFFDGTIMRMDGNTHVVFKSIEDDDGDPTIMVDLLEGNVWFNKVYKSTEDNDLQINLDNIVVISNEASVFAVADDFGAQSARVLGVFDDKGLLIEVLNEDVEKVIEEESLGVGQEIVFTDKILEKYWAYQSPTVISALSDEFKISDWYTWNLAEDETPTEFQKYVSSENVGLQQVEPEVVVEPEEGLIPADSVVIVDEESTESEESPEEEVVEEEESIDLGPLGTPAVTTVSGGTQIDEGGFYNVTGNPAVITGSISGAAKLIVNSYTLTKFNPGDTSWTYYANADYDLMQEGENIYEVYAVDAEGNKSEIITVKVRYSPPAPVVVVEEVVEEEEEVIEDTEEVEEETTEE